ncbi:lipid II flippase MurJ [Pricia sp. S334]|uniref:Lipid II flippase MurJ n=1 Tax=Pricia mediterranea TaxID=3076079 RepID=A0ABU3LAV2_9FLAO|nr:lipid II flippase MurJ [Pricia sp. S334]MDT7830217.1 lipid II flippase MurJ [Pricia sp. S334]
MKFLNQYLPQIKFKELLGNQLIQSFLTVGIITLLVKGLGFYKESVVAANFGLSKVLDTFYIAYLIPTFILNVFISAFKNVFIPNYVAELKTGKDISGIQSAGFLITGFVSVLFTLIAFLFTDVYLENIFPGHTPSYYALVKSHFYFVMPCIIFWGFSSLLSGLLNIQKEFLHSTLAGIFMPVAIIATLFLFRASLGDMVLAVGTLIGTILSFIYLLVTCLNREIINLSKPDFNNQNVRQMFVQVPAKASSGFFTGLIGVTDQYFAAQLVIGSIAALNYGLKIPAFLIGLLTIAISNVLLPYFSGSVIENRERAFHNLVRMLKLIFIVSAIAAIIGILLSDFLVELFFERKEFTAEDTERVAAIQKLFLIYAPFTICGMVVVNFLTSINKNAFMAKVSFGSMCANFVLDYILMKYYGVFGIALCSTVVHIAKSLVLFFYAMKQKKLGDAGDS